MSAAPRASPWTSGTGRPVGQVDLVPLRGAGTQGSLALAVGDGGRFGAACRA